MKKPLLITICLLAFFTCSVSASPLTNYSAGNFSIDVNYSKPTMSNDEHPNTYDCNGKGKWDYAATVGIGNKFAIQYSRANPTADENSFGNKLKLTIKEYNLLYQLNPNVSVYAGIVSGSAEWYGNLESAAKNRWQIGVQYYKPVADKLIGFASAAAGKDVQKYNIGLGYEFAPNLEMNVGYQYSKIKNFTGYYTDPTYVEDWTYKGMKYGVTYKF